MATRTEDSLAGEIRAIKDLVGYVIESLKRVGQDCEDAQFLNTDEDILHAIRQLRDVRETLEIRTHLPLG